MLRRYNRSNSHENESRQLQDRKSIVINDTSIIFFKPAIFEEKVILKHSRFFIRCSIIKTKHYYTYILSRHLNFPFLHPRSTLGCIN